MFNMQVKRIIFSPERKWFTEAQVPTTFQQCGFEVSPPSAAQLGQNSPQAHGRSPNSTAELEYQMKICPSSPESSNPYSNNMVADTMQILARLFPWKTCLSQPIQKLLRLTYMNLWLSSFEVKGFTFPSNDLPESRTTRKQMMWKDIK